MTLKEERLALRRINEAQEELDNHPVAVIWVAGIFAVLAICCIPIAGIWGYFGKYAHIDRACAVVVMIVGCFIVAALGFGVACSESDDREKAEKKLRRARYYYEDILANDEEPLVLPLPASPTTDQLIDQLLQRATPLQVIKALLTRKGENQEPAVTHVPNPPRRTR